jgi:hypothetical protein
VPRTDLATRPTARRIVGIAAPARVEFFVVILPVLGRIIKLSRPAIAPVRFSKTNSAVLAFVVLGQLNA